MRNAKTKYSLVLFISTLLTLLTSQPSKAFRVYYTQTRPDDYMYVYRYPNGDRGITKLDVVDPNAAPFLNPFNLLSFASQPFIQEIQRGGTDGLLNDLNLYKGEGWNFEKGRELRGSFNVRKLWACGIGKDCGTTRIGGINGIRNDGIGATLELEYRPSDNRKSRDPNPKADNLYWIQRIITNYPPDSPSVYNSYIDNRTKQSNGTYSNATHPYYASGQKIKPENQTDYGWFGDRPYRNTNLNRNYYWIAELYLAQGDKSNPLDVTIYNGVRWGWTYEFIRKEDGCNLVSSNGGACPTPPPPPDFMSY
ncbi:MAG: hypothetical protein HC917_00245 [Richelia sp. SM2_1_7]|nr:hypothetical protein [Richelia sp. SM2_1_7]